MTSSHQAPNKESPNLESPNIESSADDAASTSANASTSAQFALSGMRCAACAQIIEYRLRQLPGVEQVDILYAANRAEVKWQPQHLSLQAIIDSVVALGYRAMPLAKDGSDIEMQQNKTLWWRIFIAGFAMMQVMMYAFPAWMEPIPSVDGDLTPDIDRLLKLASFCLSVPVFFFSAWPFYQGAWRSLKQRQLGMDVPVSIGIIATFVASSWATFAGGAVYYDSLVMFVFLLLLARMVEAKVQQKSAQALRELTNLVPPQALLCRHYPASVEVETVLASSLQVGDVVLLQPGSAVPVDGVVLEGIGECDEALMTGESQAVLKEPGAKVIAGAINLSGRLLVRAEQVGEATQISHLVAMMARAASQKPAILQVADRHASWFLAAILLLSIASGVVWSFIDLARALPIALTVLVITCPCALSLATPAVMAAVIGQLAKRGVLVARGGAVEGLARASHFVFDKTGTLTSGQLLCTKVQVLRSDFGAEDAVRALASAIARNSQHPISRALHASKDSTSAEFSFASVEEIAGQGLQAITDSGQRYRLGKLAFCQQLHSQALPEVVGEGSLAALADERGWLALFYLQDQVRIEALHLLQHLQMAGKQVWILSGDRSDAVAALAQQLGVAANQARGDLSPEQKFAQVQSLQKNGAKVAMLGDGMNDGPVLSLADVSCAMGQGAPITQARSDLLLMSSNLHDFGYAWRSTQFALRLIQENLAWALLYNLIAIPAAVLGWLAPWHAALGMSLSSIVVVLNSLRMLRARNEFPLEE